MIVHQALFVLNGSVRNRKEQEQKTPDKACLNLCEML